MKYDKIKKCNLIENKQPIKPLNEEKNEIIDELEINKQELK